MPSRLCITIEGLPVFDPISTSRLASLVRVSRLQLGIDRYDRVFLFHRPDEGLFHRLLRR